MVVLVEGAAFGPGCGLEDNTQDPVDSLVQDGFRQLAALHGLDDVGHALRLRAGHFQVQAVLQCRHTIVNGAPVRHDATGEAPFVL